ncbi:MAG: protease family protein [Acidobacteriota bacterium]|jgi:membrane protease YdiL (CAAX protease family)|nr:protease family protein [Acidobacteriota bacterium]
MEPKDIFLNQTGRLRSGWRLAVFCVFYLAILGLSIQLIKALLLLAPDTFGPVLESNWGFVVQAVFLLIVPAVLAGWACSKFLEDLPARALGWGLQTGWLRDFLSGSLVGVASLLFAAAIATFSGGFHFALNAPLLFESVGKTLLVSCLVFIIAAAGEEALFRGYPLQTMARSHQAWVAIIITSIIFSYGHLNNPNAVAGFTFINTALAGLWLAIAYLRTRNLWFPLGIHWAWNWTMGAVLGLPVSGIERLTPHPLLRAADLGPAWLTGGHYGIEGGAACTVALLLSTFFIWRTRLVSPTEEMMRLTDQENPKPEQQQSLTIL